MLKIRFDNILHSFQNVLLGFYFLQLFFNFHHHLLRPDLLRHRRHSRHRQPGLNKSTRQSRSLSPTENPRARGDQSKSKSQSQSQNPSQENSQYVMFAVMVIESAIYIVLNMRMLYQWVSVIFFKLRVLEPQVMLF